jgi:ATP-dependent RNA helicase DeaD
MLVGRYHLISALFYEKKRVYMEKNLVFQDLQVSEEILRAVGKMGFTEATPVQSQSIPPILEGRDVVAQAPTGTGKTCAFGIPMIEGLDMQEEAVQALVLCPTRELALQITEELKNVAWYKRAVKIVPIYGGQKIDHQILSLKRRPQIIVATPGRLMDHLRRKTIRLQQLKMIVLDEADEMLNMGFREDIDTILQSVPEKRQTILFSATLSKDILAVAHKYQRKAVMVKITQKQVTVPTIKQYYLEVKPRNKVNVLASLLDLNQYKLSLVFCNTKRRVDELTAELVARGYAADALHGDMKQVQRDQVMRRFRRGATNILVATDVAARGIDVEDIEAVFNFDIPDDNEYYVHRIGRTGRAKREGVSYTFVSGRDMSRIRDITRYTKAKIEKMKAPDVLEVEDVKAGAALRCAAEIIDKESILSYAKYVTKLTEKQDCSALDVAAALLKMAVEGRQSVKTPEKKTAIDPVLEAELTGAEQGMIRLFLNMGSLDKIKNRHIFEMMRGVGVDGDMIGKIDIFDKFSFVEVVWDMAETVLEKLNHTSYKGRRLAVEKAQGRRNRSQRR